MREQPDPPSTRVADHLLALPAETPGLEVFLRRLVRLAADITSPPLACSITLRRDGDPFTAVASDHSIAGVDEVQYRERKGPCLLAFRAGSAVEIHDVVEDRRWPAFRAAALRHGVSSVLALPLTADGDTAGVMNLYSSRRQAFDGKLRERAESFTAALGLMLRQADAAQLRQDIGDAMASRSIIDQAIGILMAQQQCTATRAFELLRQASQRRNRKVRHVAADIITRVSGEPPHPPVPIRRRPSGRTEDRQADG